MVIDHQYPYLGASPDGYVECLCCGPGVIEVKCPFSCRDKSLLEATGDSAFCLETAPDGNYILKLMHSYHYQVQLQMKLCHVLYCDFVIWRRDELMVLRIHLDEDFITETIKKATVFYKYGVLAELVGKWYTKTQSMPPQSDSEDGHVASNQRTLKSEDSATWCYCNKGESGEMIACDNFQCLIQWFHLTCLKITHIPKGKWYWPNCQKKIKKKIK